MAVHKDYFNKKKIRPGILFCLSGYYSAVTMKLLNYFHIWVLHSFITALDLA